MHCELKVASFDIVFQEIPGEVTLALNLSGCPCHCPGCHSPHLWEDIGEPLEESLIDGLLARYGSMITCVCFMGGDQDPAYVAQMAEHIKKTSLSLGEGRGEASLKVAWYSGRPGTPNNLHNQNTPIPFDYVKFGPYIEALGGLKSPKTNQRLYKRVGDEWQDISSSFWHTIC